MQSSTLLAFFVSLQKMPVKYLFQNTPLMSDITYSYRKLGPVAATVSAEIFTAARRFELEMQIGPRLSIIPTNLENGEAWVTTTRGVFAARSSRGPRERERD